MPKYFFDSYNGNVFLSDAYGIDLVDEAEAIAQAEEVVKTLLAEGMLTSGNSEVAVQIRSVGDDVIHIVQGSIVSRPVTNRCLSTPSSCASSR